MFSSRILRTTGVFLLTIIIAVSFITPKSILSTEANFVYSDLQNPGEEHTKVRTKLDPGDEKAMEDLPKNIGDWRILDMVIKGYKEEELERSLNADIITVKGYLKNEPFALPVKLLTLQSKTRASFHPPEVCYPAMGYEILEEGYEDIVIPEEIWSQIEDTVDSLEMFSTGKRELNNTIRFKKLVISQEDDRGIDRRTIILYFYLGNSSAFVHLTKITMVRVSVDVLVSGSVDDSLNMAKEFLIEAIPLMFGPDEGGDRVIIDKLVHSGAGGILVAILMYLVPVSIIFAPELRKLTNRLKKRVIKQPVIS